MNKARYSILLIIAILLVVPAAAQSAVPSDFDAYVEQALKTFDAPGLAFAVVKDGKVSYARGYGVRRVGEAARVDEQTLFQIGSTTKAFTAAALAILVDEGKLQWDEPVRTYLPWFAMNDAYTSQEITTRDLLTHRGGLGMGQGDLLVYPDSDYTTREIVPRLKYMKPKWSFRGHWAYCNLCFVAAGEVVTAITGQSWSDYVQQRIFKPLGMTASRTSIVGLTTTDNVAASHELIDGKIQAVRWDNIANAGPAGSIVSNVRDMAKWITVQLNRGKLSEGNGRIFSEEQSRQMWTGQSFPPLVPPPPGLEQAKRHFYEYALGWGLWDYRGVPVVEHSGGVTGQRTEVVLLPEQNAGLVVFANPPAKSSLVVRAVMYRLMDSILGAPETDWIAKFDTVRQAQFKKAEEAQQKNAANRSGQSKPSLPLASYAGTYRDDWFGEITLAYEDGKLIFRAPHSPGLTGELEHWQNDSFVVHWKDKTVADAYLYFALTPAATVEQFKMARVSELADFSYDYEDLLFHPVPAKK